MPFYSLCERKTAGGAEPRGISCDDDGVFLAGDVPLVIRLSGAHGPPIYEARPAQDISRLLKSAYGPGIEFSAHIEGLNCIARYLTDGKWALAKIATVQLRLPVVSDDLALARLLTVEAELIAKCSRCAANKTRKRDVSDEPRIPAGQTGGGEWTTGDGAATPAPNPLLIPAQAITAPIPLPFELPLPPTEITPFPLEIPGGNLREPVPTNPYPDRPDCVAEWAHAMKFCRDQMGQGKLKPGYSGFGKDFASCLRGMVSEDCGGNPTA